VAASKVNLGLWRYRGEYLCIDSMNEDAFVPKDSESAHTSDSDCDSDPDADSGKKNTGIITTHAENDNNPSPRTPSPGGNTNGLAMMGSYGEYSVYGS